MGGLKELKWPAQRSTPLKNFGIKQEEKQTTACQASLLSCFSAEGHKSMKQSGDDDRLLTVTKE